MFYDNQLTSFTSALAKYVHICQYIQVTNNSKHWHLRYVWLPLLTLKWLFFIGLVQAIYLILQQL